MSKKIVLSVLVSLTFAAALSLWLFQKRSPGIHSSTALLFPPGSYSYDLDLQSEGSIDVSAVAKAQNPAAQTTDSVQDIQSRLQAQLDVTASERELILHLSQPRVQLQAQELDAIQLGNTDEPVVIKLDKSGQFLSISLAPQQSALMNSIWLSILSQLQAIGPAKSGLSQWEAEETDYQARYKTEYSSSSSQLTKKKLSVVSSPLIGMAALQNFTISPEQSWIAERSDAALEKLTVTDGLTLASGGQEHFHNSLTFALKKTSRPSGTYPTSKAQLAHLVTHPYDAAIINRITEAATEDSRYRQAAGDITRQQIITRLDEDMSEGDETEFYKKVRGYLYIHPEECQEFTQILIDAPYDGLALRTVGVALGRVGHAAAQKVLRDVALARIEQQKASSNYLHLLAQSPTPTKDSLDILEQLTHHNDGDVQEAALLASGTALGQQNVQDPTDASGRLHAFMKRYEVSTNAEEKNLILDLIGNSKMHDGLELLLTRIADPKPGRDRTLAIEALRMIDSDRARNQLLTLAEKGVPHDQVSAVKSLQFQPFIPEVVPLMRKAFAEVAPQSAPLRREYLSWLFQHQNSVVDVEDILETFLKVEIDDGNRKTARSLLETIRLSKVK